VGRQDKMSLIKTFENVSVAMITKNEEKAIEKVVLDIKKFAPGAEILIVDSSNDTTAQKAQKLGCKVIRQFPPKGYGPAMDLALRSSSNDIIVTLDCDDTYPAEKIPDLVSFIGEGYDLVNTSRTHQRPQHMPLMNYFANKIFALFTQAVHGIKTTDVHSGMRAYRKTMIDNLTFKIDAPALPVELLVKPIINGYRFKEINIKYNQRIGETTLDKWNSTKWTFKRIFYLRNYKSELDIFCRQRL
jgi:glycosyltransferase involved in cell wall biosynthesis